MGNIHYAMLETVCEHLVGEGISARMLMRNSHHYALPSPGRCVQLKEDPSKILTNVVRVDRIDGRSFEVIFLDGELFVTPIVLKESDLRGASGHAFDMADPEVYGHIVDWLCERSP